MPKYLVFGGSRYYPSGGIRDLIGKVETIEEARALIRARRCDWAHIVCYETMRQVAPSDID